jgi:hypothetical protein
MLEVHVMLHQRGKGTARKSSRFLARMHLILAGTRRSAREGMRSHSVCKCPTMWLLSNLDTGGEVENDARCELTHVHFERENGLRHQYPNWTRATK